MKKQKFDVDAKIQEGIFMAYELSTLRRMRSAAREKILENDPELRKAYEKYLADLREINQKPKPNTFADESGMFTFRCDECGSVFKSSGRYAKCKCCGEDTNGMVHLA